MRQAQSSRHHYIPQFFIRGFIAPETQIWIYDKQSGKIRPKGPKAIFYQNKSNTLRIAGLETDSLETGLFQKIDDSLSIPINRMQTAGFDSDDIAQLRILILTILFRTPVTVDWTRNLTIQGLNKSVSQKWKDIVTALNNLTVNSSDYLKLLDAVGPYILIDLGVGDVTEESKFHLLTGSAPSFILADMPILFRHKPTQLRDILKDFIFPYTSRRAFLGYPYPNRTMTEDEVLTVNYLLALQSKRYFGCEDLRVLEATVEKLCSRPKVGSDEFWENTDTIFIQLSKNG